MAEKLLKYYKFMKDCQGGTGQIGLAMQTKVPSTRAALVPDAPETILLFQQAIEKLTGKPAPRF
jgi:hypothetical protein